MTDLMTYLGKIFSTNSLMPRFEFFLINFTRLRDFFKTELSHFF